MLHLLKKVMGKGEISLSQQVIEIPPIAKFLPDDEIPRYPPFVKGLSLWLRLCGRTPSHCRGQASLGCECRRDRHTNAYPVDLAEEGLPFALLGSRRQGALVLKGKKIPVPEII